MVLDNQNPLLESSSSTHQQQTTQKLNQKLIHTKLSTRRSLMQLGCCLASLGMLSKGIVLAEAVLEIEVYDYEPSYQPAPVDSYSPQTSYSAPSYSPEPSYSEPYYAPTPSYAPEPYYSQPAPTYNEPEPYYSASPGYSEPYYSQPAPTYYEPEPYYSQPAPTYNEPEPYYSQPAPTYEPEPYYSQPAPTYEPEPYYSQPAPTYYEAEPYYSQPTPTYEPEPYYSQPAPTYEPEPYYSQPAPTYYEAPSEPLEADAEGGIYIPKNLYVAPPTANIAVNLSKKPKGNLPLVTLPKQKKPDYNGSANAYIDQTDYQLGATDSYEAPSTVVFSERSTGCEATLQTGEGIDASVCDYASSSSYAASNDNWSAPTEANNWSAPTEANNWSAPTEANNWSAPTEANNWSAPTEANNWSAPTQTANNNSWDEGTQQAYYSQNSYQDSSYSQNSYYSDSSSSPDSYYSSYSQDSYYSDSSYNQDGYYSSYAYAPSYDSGYSEGVEVAAILPAQMQGLFDNPITQSGLAYYNRTKRPPAVPGNGNTSLIFPLSIPAPITSLFGWRKHPVLGYKRFHTGTDLGAPTGTPVIATYAGQVAIADWLGGYGVSVVLDHQNKSLETLYGHLSEIFVKPGEFVQQGEVIGRVGNTGMSTGPHLHFEMRQLTDQGWIAKNPDTQIQFALANLMTALKITELPPVPKISIDELVKQTKELDSGRPQLPPLPPGFEVPIPDLEPPIFELTKASDKSKENTQISQNQQEKTAVQ